MRDEHNGAGTPAAPRLLRFPAVRARTGIGPTATYAAIKSGEFPRPVKVGAASLWLESEVDAWIAARIAARDAAHAGAGTKGDAAEPAWKAKLRSRSAAPVVAP